MTSDSQSFERPRLRAVVGGSFNPWGVALIYTFAVILFGAVVRITGSGAGCGQHWPTCQGDVVHLPKTVETLIEFSHRLTSGVSLLVVIGLTAQAFRSRPRGDLVRRAATVATVSILVEALIGAMLVLLRYVGENASLGRAVIMALHLVNTLALTGAMGVALMAWRLSPGHKLVWASQAGFRTLLGALGIVVVAAAGAVTALGDTLYPVAAGEARLVLEGGGGHFLERLRGFHPLLAIGVSCALLFVVPTLRASCSQRERGALWARGFVLTVYAQLALGLVNVLLGAPGFMQVIHLAAALVLWLFWVALGFEALRVPPGQSSQGVS